MFIPQIVDDITVENDNLESIHISLVPEISARVGSNLKPSYLEVFGPNSEGFKSLPKAGTRRYTALFIEGVETIEATVAGSPKTLKHGNMVLVEGGQEVTIAENEDLSVYCFHFVMADFKL